MKAAKFLTLILAVPLLVQLGASGQTSPPDDQVPKGTAITYQGFLTNTAANVPINADGTFALDLRDSADQSDTDREGDRSRPQRRASNFHPFRPGKFWKLRGNLNTTPPPLGPNFLGTIDNVALELHVGEGVAGNPPSRALRLEPNSTSPNLIGGFKDNLVPMFVVGATISGGGKDAFPNLVTDDYGAIGGGRGNTASGQASTVGGGAINTASGLFSTIGGGGPKNIASGVNSTIGGGSNNVASLSWATIGGGERNTTSGVFSTVGGGQENTASSDYATVGGGINNEAAARYSTIAGGGSSSFADPLNTNNRVTDDYGTIGGGGNNQAGDNVAPTNNARFAAVAGGDGNTASGGWSAIGGGQGNTAGALGATIGGGGNTDFPNRVTDDYGTIGGGLDNRAGDGPGPTDQFATVGGGVSNAANRRRSTVGGGEGNVADAISATVGGGSGNMASGTESIVGGGVANTASGVGSAVGGGSSNTASGDQSTVGGGFTNTASGLRSTVAGGVFNTAGGDFSFAAGQRAKVRDAAARGDADGDEGTFVWSDSTTASPAFFESTGPNQFLIRAAGGVGIGRNNPAHPLHVGTNSSNGNGAHVTAGGMWTNGSDRNSKQGFEAVSKRKILAKVVDLPITEWKYKGEHEAVRHIGPVAQDFHAAFGLGASDKHIGTLDADGVALAAIQGLYEMVKEKDAEIAALRAEMDDRIAALAAKLAELTAKEDK